IDLNGAVDVTNVAAADLKNYAVPKTPFLNVVAVLNANGINSYLIPSKIEGIAFGQDILLDGVTKHTLWVANDNDFLATIADPFKLPGDPTRGFTPNPNQFYVFAFGDTDLPPGYSYVPQRFTGSQQ